MTETEKVNKLLKLTQTDNFNKLNELIHAGLKSKETEQK